MLYSELIKKVQTQLNKLGEQLDVDGDPGPLTQAALMKYDISLVASPMISAPLPISGPHTHVHPIDWCRRYIGQREIYGAQDNPFIRELYKHCANIGSKEYPDEIPWCSAFINAAADACGMEKTDNALVYPWCSYGMDSGELVEEGDVVCIGTSHVTLANKPFNRSKDLTFEGLGGNQGDMVKVSVFSMASVSACRKWKPKPGTITLPIGTLAQKATGNGDSESTR